MQKQKKYKNILRDFIYSVRIPFQASRKYFLCKATTTVILAALAFFVLILWRDTLNLVTDAATGTSVPFSKIAVLLALYFLCYMAQKFIGVADELIQYKYNDAVEVYLDNMMVQKISGIDLAFFDDSELGDQVAHSWTILSSVQMTAWKMFTLLDCVIKMATSFALLCSLSIWLALLVVLLSVPALALSHRTSRLQYEYQMDSAKKYRRMDYNKELFYREYAADMRLYGLASKFMDNYKELWSQWYHNRKRVSLKTCVINFGSILLLSVGDVAMYVDLVGRLFKRVIGIGDISYFTSLLSNFRSNVSTFLFVMVEIMQGFQELHRVQELMEMEPLMEHGGTYPLDEIKEICFEQVGFTYPRQKEPVLNDCSFTITKGETVGLVGLNGAGKTTIVKLLLRFYDVTQGKITINGMDIRDYELTSLRRAFGVLFQDFVRYSMTAKENISLSDLEHCEDIRRINTISHQSGVSEFALEWEHGLDTPLTRRFDNTGIELSGGQWQKISLARTLFRSCDFIVLDEPSASLDPESEYRIFEQFKQLSEGKTALLISHRLSNIMLCSHIVVLDGGHVSQQGTHQELMKQGGEYASLFTIQSRKYQ